MSAGNTSRTETIAMVSYFSDHHKRVLQGKLPKDGNPILVADCAWFKLDKVFDFLTAIQDQGATGVRLYFGAHCHKEDGDIYGYNNVILVGTKGNGTGPNMDLPVPVALLDSEDYSLSTKAKVADVVNPQLDDNSDLNNAHLCPPHCDGGESI